MKGKLIWSIFWALVGVFVILASVIYFPPLNNPMRIVFLPGIAIFLLLGAALIFFTVKEKVGGVLKKFLILTGASATGLPIGVLLHNMVSGLFNTEEPFFFIMATIVCPIGFLVGVVGSIVLAIKNKRVKYSS